MKTIMTTAILMISWTLVGKRVFSLSVPQRVFSLRTGAPRSFRRKSGARTRILHYGIRPRPYCEVFWPPTPHIPQSIRRDLSHDQGKEAPHRRQLNEHFYAGRFPQKAAGRIFKLLEELEASAEYRNLDTERLKIIHAAAQRGTKVPKRNPRAFGRSDLLQGTMTHVELVGYELE